MSQVNYITLSEAVNEGGWMQNRFKNLSKI
jgi:hypothetical protein